MRIAYGVMGYGRGHATRSAAVLSVLEKRHHVHVFCGGDAYTALHDRFPVTEIPTFGYVYNTAGKLSAWQTLSRNTQMTADLLLRGSTLRSVIQQLEAFRPDVVISDSEAWTHRAAEALGVPHISFDHVGVMAYCRPKMPLQDWWHSRRDVLVYNLFMGRPDRVMVSSFYTAPLRRKDAVQIGPVLREEVLHIKASYAGHLLVYLNKGRHQFTPALKAALLELDRPVVIYGTPHIGWEDNLRFEPLGTHTFLRHLASCEALISTAGHQLLSEAIYYRKPVLAMPEDVVEQRLNAAKLQRLGIGEQAALYTLSSGRIQAFLTNLAIYRLRLAGLGQDCRDEAVAYLERFMHELVIAPKAGIHSSTERELVSA